MNSSLYNLSSAHLNYNLPQLSYSDASFSRLAMNHITQNVMFDKNKPEIQTSTESRIKRPPNSFMIWSTIERKKISKEFPQMHNSEISKQLGQKWKTIPEETKNIFRMKSQEFKIKHLKRYPNYKYQPQRRKKKVSLSIPPQIKLFNDTFPFDSPIPNVAPNPYCTKYSNNYAPYEPATTTPTPFINNNIYNIYHNASVAEFANNLVQPNCYTPHSSMMSFSTTKLADMPYWTFPSTSNHKSENCDVYRIYNPQNSSQLTPSNNHPMRKPLSEYNQ